MIYLDQREKGEAKLNNTSLPKEYVEKLQRLSINNVKTLRGALLREGAAAKLGKSLDITASKVRELLMDAKII